MGDGYIHYLDYGLVFKYMYIYLFIHTSIYEAYYMSILPQQSFLKFRNIASKKKINIILPLGRMT